MTEKEQITNYEHYKTEIDEIQWFIDKIDADLGQLNSKNVINKNNTKIIATITSRTTKAEIKQMINSGLRIFMIKCAMFKAEEYTVLIKKVTAELLNVSETPTFIFDLQGPIPTVSNLYNKERKVEKISVRSGQLIKISNKNKSLPNSDLIVIDKKIYNSVNKGDNVIFNSNVIMKVIHLERFDHDKEKKQFPAEGKEIHYIREKIPSQNRSYNSLLHLENSFSQNIRRSDNLFHDHDGGSIKKNTDESFHSIESRSKFLMNCLSQLEATNEYRLSFFKDKENIMARPELYFDFNQGDILKNKQNLLNNEYKRIIQSKHFVIYEMDEEENMNSIPNFKSFYAHEGFGLDDSHHIHDYKGIPEEYEDLKKKKIALSNSFSLKERQMLLDKGFRFTSIPASRINNTNSDKKIVVCEVETPGDINLLSEVYVMGKQPNYSGLTNTLGPKEITDIGKASSLNITTLSMIANKASDIKEVRKIVSDDTYEGKSEDEGNPKYRSFALHKIKVLAKIVTNSSIFNFDEILVEADGIILDPNALSLNIDYDDQCLIDKYIIEKCKLKNKPIYIKSNCFTSKTRNLFSASDITSFDDSINSGIDGFILNEEFPFEFYTSLKKMIMDIEKLSEGKDNYEKISKTVKLNIEEFTKSYNSLKSLNTFHILETLFDSAIKLSYEVNISLIFLYCDSYLTVKRLSKYRPNCRIICATGNLNEFNFIRIFRGVSAFLTKHKNISFFNEALFNE